MKKILLYGLLVFILLGFIGDIIGSFAEGNLKKGFISLGLLLAGAAIVIYFKVKKAKEIKRKRADVFNKIEEYKNGNIPILTATGFITDKGEDVHFLLDDVSYVNTNGRTECIGRLQLTNKRIIFITDNRTHQYNFKDLMICNQVGCGIQLQARKDKSARMYSVTNPYEFSKFYFLCNYLLNTEKDGNAVSGLSVNIADLAKEVADIK
jgi:hypothetical protein